MKFFIATKNQHKMQEFKKILEKSNIELICETDLSSPIEDVEENGTTFEQNALIKAKSGRIATGLPSIADDSGLCVDFLGGEPGIYSARYAGEHGDDGANNEKLLKNLAGVPKSERTARFVCAIACVFPDGREFTVTGSCEGYIADAPSGNGGFGYDPLFVSEIGCFGEISPEQKNKVSHRAKAIEKFEIELKKYI
ncbi:MAG: XTP/dITP diphosphatase [Acutalibacteraceae bacterium]|nr:XTP/dITP diphosphatase [Acutalibacteraceae bacterium]